MQHILALPATSPASAGSQLADPSASHCKLACVYLHGTIQVDEAGTQRGRRTVAGAGVIAGCAGRRRDGACRSKRQDSVTLTGAVKFDDVWQQGLLDLTARQNQQ